VARRRATASSGTKIHVLGDLAFSELLGRALPFLSEDDRRIVELIKSGCSADEVAELMNLTREGGSDAHIARAEQELVRACRTVVAAPRFWNRAVRALSSPVTRPGGGGLLERRSLLQAEFAKASKDYKGFDVAVDTDRQYLNFGGLVWTTGHFLARKKAAGNAYDSARAEAGKLPES
jgi:hypothetical protein